MINIGNVLYATLWQTIQKRSHRNKAKYADIFIVNVITRNIINDNDVDLKYYQLIYQVQYFLKQKSTL